MKNQNNNFASKTGFTTKISTLFFTALFVLAAHTSFAAPNYNFEDFFREKGVALLADYAHPLNTMSSGSYAIYGDQIVVDIYYKEGSHTRLSISKSGNFFTGITISDPDEFFAPFAGIYLLKTFISENISREDESQIEAALHRSIDRMSGSDLACVALTGSWLKY